jgi:hypothetical protein
MSKLNGTIAGFGDYCLNGARQGELRVERNEKGKGENVPGSPW